MENQNAEITGDGRRDWAAFEESCFKSAVLSESEKDGGKCRYELDGVIHDSFESAAAAARIAILSELDKKRDQYRDDARGFLLIGSDADNQQANPIVTLAEPHFELSAAILPENATKVTGTIRATMPAGPCSSYTRGVTKTVRRVAPGEPARGKHRAKRWTREDLGFWNGFDDDLMIYDGCSQEERRCAQIAAFISDAMGCGKPASFFLEDLAAIWSRAKNEAQRNEVADYLVCEMDLGIFDTYHEALANLPSELLQLAGEITSVD